MNIKKYIIVATVFLSLGFCAKHLMADKIYLHKIDTATINIDRFVHPIHVRWNMLESDQILREKHRWLDTYLTFHQLDKASYDTWIETVSENYKEEFGITEEAFNIAKESYDPGAADHLAGAFHTFFYAVYFELNDRHFCRVVGATSDSKYKHIEDAVKADKDNHKGFLTLFFEKINGRWKMQLHESGTWIDDVGILPNQIDSLKTNRHLIKVKNTNRLATFSLKGVREEDLVLEDSYN